MTWLRQMWWPVFGWCVAVTWRLILGGMVAGIGMWLILGQPRI